MKEFTRLILTPDIVKQNIQDNFEKAKGHPEGTIKIWSGEKFQKVNGQWKYLGKAEKQETSIKFEDIDSKKISKEELESIKGKTFTYDNQNWAVFGINSKASKYNVFIKRSPADPGFGISATPEILKQIKSGKVTSHILEGYTTYKSKTFEKEEEKKVYKGGEITLDVGGDSMPKFKQSEKSGRWSMTGGLIPERAIGFIEKKLLAENKSNELVEKKQSETRVGDIKKRYRFFGRNVEFVNVPSGGGYNGGWRIEGDFTMNDKDFQEFKSQFEKKSDPNKIQSQYKWDKDHPYTVEVWDKGEKFNSDYMDKENVKKFLDKHISGKKNSTDWDVWKWDETGSSENPENKRDFGYRNF